MNDGPKGVEEERRLAYVAFTRAKNKLFITEAGGYSYILQKVRTPSRFIEEIDDAYIEHQGAVEQKKQSPVITSFILSEGSFSERVRNSAVPQFKKGEQVVHTKFGEGVVLSCKDGIAEIAFPYPYGIKKIAAGHPTLKRKSEIVN